MFLGYKNQLPTCEVTIKWMLNGDGDDDDGDDDDGDDDDGDAADDDDDDGGDADADGGDDVPGC